MNNHLTRRDALQVAGSLALAAAPLPAAPASAGRLKQSVARWCYAKIPLDDLCRQAAEMGLSGIDLVDQEDWPTLRKYGLVPALIPGTKHMPNGWNRRENHARLEQEVNDLIQLATAAKAPNVITMSGNRAGLSDEEGKQNCIAGLRRISKRAEDSGVTVCLEVLNSKVNHKDYQCDHTAWAVDVIKGVESPRVRVLYDIYHMQIMEGDIIRTIRDNFQYIAHFHTGGVPGRHELDDTQELRWHTIAKAIADFNYQGFVAHEFVPTRDPMTSLRQAVQECTV
jgi:hydroxypyruvate isomerase